MLAAAINPAGTFLRKAIKIILTDGIRQLGVRFSDAVSRCASLPAKAGLIEFLRQPFRFCVRLRALRALENFNKIELREKLEQSAADTFLPFIRADHALIPCMMVLVLKIPHGRS